MPKFTINIPDAELDRVLDAFAGAHQYRDTFPNGDVNPESKQQFVRCMLVEHIAMTVKRWEGRQAARAARDAVVSTSETIAN